MTCRHCIHFDIDRVLDKAGRVRADRPGRCLFDPAEIRAMLPISITIGVGFSLEKSRMAMRADDGEGCPQFKERRS